MVREGNKILNNVKGYLKERKEELLKETAIIATCIKKII
jgi:hypothetical protein